MYAILEVTLPGEAPRVRAVPAGQTLRIIFRRRYWFFWHRQVAATVKVITSSEGDLSELQGLQGGPVYDLPQVS